MRATFLSIGLVLLFGFSYGQADNQSYKNTSVGFELDALPYLT